MHSGQGPFTMARRSPAPTYPRTWLACLPYSVLRMLTSSPPLSASEA